MNRNAERNQKKQKKDKNKLTTYKIHSPQILESRSQRRIFQRKLSNSAQIENNKPNIPLYFIKKKQSQKRRRQYKDLLIRVYKYELLKIFGRLIYKKGWRIGIKDLKDILQLDQRYYDEQYMKQTLQIRRNNYQNHLLHQQWLRNIRRINIRLAIDQRFKKNAIYFNRKRTQQQYVKKKRRDKKAIERRNAAADFIKSKLLKMIRNNEFVHKQVSKEQRLQKINKQKIKYQKHKQILVE